MRKKTTDAQIRRTFTVDQYQGAAAMMANSTAEGLPLRRMERQGTRVVCIYGASKANTGGEK